MMDPSKLRDRLATVIRPRVAVDAGASTIEGAPPARSSDTVADAVGGEWRRTDAGRCLVIDRRFDPETAYGAQPVGRIAGALRRSVDCAAFVASGSAPRVPWLFFDLETTGLSGGAGTYAFLVGCGWFEGDAFATKQYLLTTAAEEKGMLLAFGRDLSASGALVSFNGKSFDAPLLETRCAYHRVSWVGAGHPHLDMLHPARRLWSARLSTTDDAGCSLTTLEREMLGAGRTHDVPGFEVPARYFHFLRSGDVRPLGGLLDHNRRDLLALAAVTARILTLLADGADGTCDAAEALALGRIYARAGDDGRASRAFERAASEGGDAVRVEALRELARRARRARRYDEAAAWWRRVLESPACSPRLAAEATEALAIHHEHRVRDLAAARRFAMLSLNGSEKRTWIDAVRHRLARIDRKIDRGARLDLG